MRLAAPLTAVAMLICSPVAWGQPAPGPATPLSHPDPRDAPSSPLDVRDVIFGQRGITLVLRIRLQQAWTPRKLNGTRSVCVLISRASTLAHPKRVCVRLRGKRTLRTTVLPSALGLPLGPVWWAVESRWDDAVDRVPDSGALETSIKAFAAPPCFGAAARASGRPCRNPALAKSAYPAPDDAAVWPSAACTPLRAAFDACAFGVSKRRSRATVALVGDSHAVHWRAALEVVAQVERWRGISIARPGCPFSTQVPISPALGPAACVAQHAATIAWLRAHPAIRTVFVSDWAEPPSGPQGGIGGYGGGAAAYGAMLDRLPRSVRHIYVLRDVPGTTLRSITCVESRLRRRRAIRTGCASPRSAVVTPDPGASAAAARRPRAHVLDLTRFFCGATRCFPVVGGVYVHKDDNHMNAVFSASLGPFVLRALQPSGT